MIRPEFHPLQAQEIARAFQEAGVEYLFLGKGGAILLGFPGTTQDIDLFPARTPENGRRIVAALRTIGFDIDADLERQIVACKDFVQIKEGPFDVDLVFAPDGIDSFSAANARGITIGIFRVAHPADIIASKRASGRQKDLADLPLLESFREEFELRRSRPLRSAGEIAAGRPPEQPPQA